MCRVLVSSVLSGTCAPALAEASPLEMRDLFALQAVEDPQISRDGKSVLYTRVRFDVDTDRARRSIWLWDVSSGRQTALEDQYESAQSPRWSADGGRVAFLAQVAGESAQLHIRLVGSATERQVGSLPFAPQDITWSADGRFLAFTMFVPSEVRTLATPLAKSPSQHWAEPIREIDRLIYQSDSEGYVPPGHRRVFTIDVSNGSLQQLTSGDSDDSGPLAWSPDDHSIVYSSRRMATDASHARDSEIFRVDVANATVRQLTHRLGPDESPAISPDGRHIAYVGFDEHAMSYQNRLLSIMDFPGGSSRAIGAKLDRDMDNPVWAPDGRAVYVLSGDKGSMRVVRIGLDGSVQTVVPLVAGHSLEVPYSHGGQFTVAGDGTVAFTLGGFDHPADLALVRHGRIERLTDLNGPLFSARQLATLHPLAMTSSADGRSIDAWMVLPPDFDSRRRYPLILEIHGGPLGSYGPLWSSTHQLYAAAGYIVLYANPRGSTTYGEAFANLIHHDYPDADATDLLSAVDAAVSTGSVDPERLFVTGGSGGGLLSAWLIGKTGRFRAAAVRKPVINWTSMVLTTDLPVEDPRYLIGALPWENFEQYWRHSPLSLAGKMETPTLLIVGERDLRTPLGEAVQLYRALQLRGVPSVLIEVPGASHDSLAARPSQFAAQLSATLTWFGRYGGVATAR